MKRQGAERKWATLSGVIHADRHGHPGSGTLHLGALFYQICMLELPTNVQKTPMLESGSIFGDKSGLCHGFLLHGACRMVPAIKGSSSSLLTKGQEKDSPRPVEERRLCALYTHKHRST